MNDPIIRIPVGSWAESAVDWLTSTFSGLFAFIKTVLGSAYEGLDQILTAPPFWVVVLVLAGLAWWVKSWKMALGTVIGLVLIQTMNQWDNAMHTLALVLIATVIALAIAVPVGILAARNDAVSRVIRPVLDLMQTLPALVYLVPMVLIFLTGAVPGLVATIIFAMAPGVRFTELGIRQVDREVVEAGEAFGASSGRILRQIQLPLATRTIMAGVNQVIMLALSMVVIAGFVGAAGLGSDVTRALSSINIGLGFEAGLAVVILAVYLDRVTSALGTRSAVAKAQTAAS
ncbi:ABC transporter permease [Serinibacter arcticus]|uniref:L-proline glycine betaine ABC transport system permease protein ProW n=1 Tax=Serinibacter arcticus TaxID=1655435 RepID=A0A4Z1E0A0_9MICO|nr:proline/glycine betaine ABC transporter permease [Serinibacter arcticus]TGO04062.1 L-proline glycine betaine ABC transport system permease protein ProW [Serinibacter arcticus]